MSELIYPQIAKVMAGIPSIGKDRKAGSGSGEFGYQFRGIDDVYNALHPLLAEHKIFPMPEVLEVERTEVTNNKGKKMLRTTVKVKYTFYAEDGSNVSCVTIGEGIDYGDKSGNKAMSGAEKYAFFQVFCIPTDEPKDSENDSPELGDSKPAEPTDEQIAKAKTIAENLKEATNTPHLQNKWAGFGGNDNPDIPVSLELAKLPEGLQKRLRATYDLVHGELKAKYKAEKGDTEAEAIEKDAERGEGE